jgi:hypothetical protein
MVAALDELLESLKELDLRVKVTIVTATHRCQNF